MSGKHDLGFAPIEEIGYLNQKRNTDSKRQRHAECQDGPVITSQGKRAINDLQQKIDRLERARAKDKKKIREM